MRRRIIFHPAGLDGLEPRIAPSATGVSAEVAKAPGHDHHATGHHESGHHEGVGHDHTGGSHDHRKK